MTINKAALIILDGWGIEPNHGVNAIAQAHTPYMDELMNQQPNATLVTYGEEVGLPTGQMGNSEVGHLNIGAGRVVHQELARINNAVRDNTIGSNPALVEAIQHAQSNGNRIHLLGLVSDGGVHAHVDHLIALAGITAHAGLTTYVHAFLDGRDTDPRSGKGFVKQVQDSTSGKDIHLASVIGRYYAMDRDKRWERIKKAYDLLVHGTGVKSTDILSTIQDHYDKDVTDEFMPAILTDREGILRDNDTVIFVNFRTDRPRELTYALTQQSLLDYDMQPLPLHFVTMTNYDDTYVGLHTMFDKENISNTIGEVIAQEGCTQLRMAETEKYPHVTFFLSGGREEPFEGEKRIVIPSPKVATYDLQPEMSAYQVTDSLLDEITQRPPHFVCVNYANTDMVGHTGVLSAAIKAAETVDTCLSRLVPALLDKGYSIVILADHGNADIMVNVDGSPHTAHTTNLVPVILVSSTPEEYTLGNGKLGDIAPTILSLMGIEVPQEMTGNILHTKNK